MTAENELLENWKYTSLADVCDIELGQSPPSDTYNSDGIGLPFYQGKAEFGEIHPTPVKWCSSPKKIANAGDILISVRAPVGPVNICQETSCIGRGLAAIRPKNGMIGKYVYYYLKLIEKEWDCKATGTTFKAINGNVLRQQQIPIAPTEEQEKIVTKIEELFSQLDAATAALKRVQANLKRYKASVLKAACEGRLVPTEAELARQEGRSYESGAELLERILKERRRRWEEEQRAKGKDPAKMKYPEPAKPATEGLPELPEGWVWAIVKQLGKVQLGRQRTPKYHSGKFMRPYLRVANVFENRIDTRDILFMDFPPNDYEKYKLFYGDILLNEGQSPEFLGRPAIYRNEVPGACFQNTLIRFQCYSGLLPEFAILLFRHYLHSGRFAKESQITTNIAHLGAERFSEIEILLPPLREQKRIVDETDRIFAITKKNASFIDLQEKRSKRMRLAILDKAFKGLL